MEQILDINNSKEISNKLKSLLYGSGLLLDILNL